MEIAKRRDSTAEKAKKDIKVNEGREKGGDLGSCNELTTGDENLGSSAVMPERGDASKLRLV